MREVVDHYFPPVNMLVKGGGEEYTDFTYWRGSCARAGRLSGSESDDKDPDQEERMSEDEDMNEEMGDATSPATRSMIMMTIMD